MEVFNIIYNSSSEQIHNTKIDILSEKNANNFIRVPEIPKKKKCTGLLWCKNFQQPSK